MRRCTFILTGILLIQSLRFSLASAQIISATDPYAPPPRPSSNEPEEPEIEEVINRNLSDLRSSDKKSLEMAISRIHHELPLAVGKKHKLPRMDTSRKLSRELISAYKRIPAKDFSSPRIRRDLIQMIALYGDDRVAKTFVLQLLDKGSNEERAATLAVVGVLGVTGDELYDKIQELARRHLIKPEERTTLLVRINKERALPEVLKEITSSHDKKCVLYSAWALQEYYRKPEYYSVILPRLKELDFGKPNTFKDTNGLFWLSADLFAAYIEVAQGAELNSALEFILEHDEVRRPSISPIVMHKLDDQNPQVRTLAAGILSRLASDYSQADSEAIKHSLRRALDRETDRAASQSLQDALASIQRSEKDWQWTLEQMRRRQK